MESQSSQTATTSNTKKWTFRSGIWEHYTVVEENDPEDPKAKCNYCGQLYACHARKNGTSNMTRHLRVCKKYLSGLDNKQTTLPFVKREGESSSSSLSTSFTQEGGRNCIARMLIKDELPMRMVEWEGFRELLKYFQGLFVMPSRRTVGRDIEQIYKKEKEKLKEYIKKCKQRVCLTTDTWTSNQNVNYMVLTGHFVDGEWKLHKKIMNFCKIEDHRGETIASILERCLLDWGIENVFTITVDNASSNDVAITHLVKSLRRWNGLVLDGDCIHVCCFAHILNLIVSDGLKEHQGSISKVRRAVKYVKSSPGRLQQFKSCIDSLKIAFKGNVSLDVATRGNSMYLMLQNIEKYSNAFEKLGECDRNYILAMEDEGLPTADDWAIIREFCKFLKVFYDTTLKVSASLHITSNVYIMEVCEVKMNIQKHVENDNVFLRKMTLGMLNKFDKYWGSFEKINSLMFVAILLDPRCKSKILRHYLTILLGNEREADSMKQQVEKLLEQLYLEYKGEDIPSSSTVANPPKTSTLVLTTYFGNALEGATSTSDSEVDEYLNDKVEKYSDTLDIITWWKVNSHKYPILSQIAKDVLVIPISTVASESAFSCGGRIIDSARTSLLPTTVEAIICTQSWIRSEIPTMNLVDDYATIDEEIAAKIVRARKEMKNYQRQQLLNCKDLRTSD